MIADFEYFAPKTVSEAVSFLSRHRDSKIIAGGQSLQCRALHECQVSKVHI